MSVCISFRKDNQKWRRMEKENGRWKTKNYFATKQDAINNIKPIVIKEKRMNWIENNQCYIPISTGETATCDEDRFEEVSKHFWCLTKGGYPQARINNKLVTLHRFLYPEISRIDHINMNPLDNRSCNLRPCSRSQNGSNRGKQKNNTTGFKGVTLHKQNNNFVAQIFFKQKRIHVGSYATAIEAAKAYDTKAKELFGDFANLNFK